MFDGSYGSTARLYLFSSKKDKSYIDSVYPVIYGWFLKSHPRIIIVIVVIIIGYPDDLFKLGPQRF